MGVQAVTAYVDDPDFTLHQGDALEVAPNPAGRVGSLQRLQQLSLLAEGAA